MIAPSKAQPRLSPANSRWSTAPSAQVTAYLDGLVTRNREVGITYLLLDTSGIVFEHTAGLRDVVSRQPVTAHTTFLTASSSKVVTAAAVLQLVDRGKLRLDTPVDDYLPDLPYGRRLTVRHLLNQSSGLPNPLPLKWLHTPDEHASYDEAATLGRVIAKYSKLEFEPGQRYAYSNLSYWLLGSVIANVSGSSFCDYLRQELFAPLDIDASELDCEVRDWSQHAHGHSERFSMLGLLLPLMTEARFWDGGLGKWKRFAHLYMNGPAYGGLMGTARGYAKFLHDLLSPHSKLFSDAVRDEFFVEQRDNRGELLPTTLGWHRTEVSGIVAFSKPGGGPGFNSNVRLYPTLGLGSVYLSNHMRASERAIQALLDTLDAPFIAAR